MTVDTRVPSPFAASLLFGFVASFLYDGDAPFAERRAQALAIDQVQLRDLLGEAELRELLDATLLRELEERLQHRAPDLRARSADALADLLLRLGNLSREELAARSASPDVASSGAAGYDSAQEHAKYVPQPWCGAGEGVPPTDISETSSAVTAGCRSARRSRMRVRSDGLGWTGGTVARSPAAAVRPHRRGRRGGGIARHVGGGLGRRDIHRHRHHRSGVETASGGAGGAGCSAGGEAPEVPGPAPPGRSSGRSAGVSAVFTTSRCSGRAPVVGQQFEADGHRRRHHERHHTAGQQRRRAALRAVDGASSGRRGR